MAKAKLEKVLEHLIHKDEDAARDLLHQVIVEKAKQIHEELMQEDDFSDEEGVEVEENEDPDNSDEMEFEEYFDESDLDEADDDPVDDDEAAADLAGDLGADFGDEDLGDEGEPVDDVGDDVGDDIGDDEDLKAAIEELQQEFERLQDEVKDLQGEEGGEEDLGDLDTGDFDTGDEVVDDELPVTQEESDEEVSEEDEDFFEELDGLLGEDFDDLSEAIVDELEPVKRDPRKDQYVGADQRDFKAASRASTFAPKDFESRHKARPYEIKSSTHHGYEMERSPEVKKGDAQRYKNSMRGSDDSLSRVKPETYSGSHLASAEGADPLAFDKKANKGDGNKTSKFKNFTDDGRAPKVVRESASKKNASKQTGAAPKSKSNKNRTK